MGRCKPKILVRRCCHAALLPPDFGSQHCFHANLCLRPGVRPGHCGSGAVLVPWLWLSDVMCAWRDRPVKITQRSTFARKHSVDNVCNVLS